MVVRVKVKVKVRVKVLVKVEVKVKVKVRVKVVSLGNVLYCFGFYQTRLLVGGAG